MFSRLTMLIGEKNLNIIKDTRILLVGVGGVGGFTLEALVRSGFANITVIDGDEINVSNLNRQIISNQGNINKKKVVEALDRCNKINPNNNIKIFDIYLDEDNFGKYITKDFDYIIDAIDDVKIKVKLIKFAQDNNIKIICALGTGKKLDASNLKITTLNKTENDPLAKKLRYLLRKEKLDLKVPVVYSNETVKDTNTVIASCIFVPAVAGIYLANYIFLDILKLQDNS